MRRLLHVSSVLIVFGTGLMLPALASGASSATERVSVDPAGGDANGLSAFGLDLSSDGRFVAFASEASNLVVGDGNGARDIFVRDRVTSTTERVSVSMFGGDHDGQPFGTFDASITADGRYIAFTSNAFNIVAATPCVPGANGCISFPHVYVRDRATGTTERITLVGPAGSNASRPRISGDGRFVAFISNAHRSSFPYCCGNDVHLRDRTLGTTQLVSVSTTGDLPNGDSWDLNISADGQHVAFWSLASNLVANDGNGTGGTFGGPGGDIFVRDLATNTTERINVSMLGGDSAGVPAQRPVISADGRFVAFWSDASDLVAGDTNGEEDVFVRDRLTGTTERVSVSSAGVEGVVNSFTGDISADGRYVAFYSSSFNLVPDKQTGFFDVFVRDRTLGTTARVSRSLSCGDPNASSPVTNGEVAITPDSHYVAFNSGASNLVANDGGFSDMFVADYPNCVEVLAGHARVVKTVNRVAPGPGQEFTFELRQNASTTQGGSVLESQVANNTNGGVLNFAQALTPGVTYALCETVMPGWSTTLESAYNVYNPDGDNSVICTDFSVESDELKTFAVENRPPPGGVARTIGFWKNWSSCAGSSGKQRPILDMTLAKAGSITLGALRVRDCSAAVRILNKQDVKTGAKMASDAAYALAAQLLAAKLNVVAGAHACASVTSAITDAQALLNLIKFSGTGGYASKMPAAQVTNANALANTLDRYNNNLLC